MIFRRRRAAAATAAEFVRGGGGSLVLRVRVCNLVFRLSHNSTLNRIGDGFGSGPTGPGPTDDHPFHLHHRDFTVTPITDQIGPIDSVSETEYYDLKNHFSEPQCKMTVLPINSGKPRTCVTVKRLATSPHDPLGITDSACKNQLVVVSIQYDPFNPYIPIRSTTIGKSRVAIDPIAMHTSWRSNSDIASVTRDTASRGPTTIAAPESQFRTCPTDHDSIGYPRMSASGESSTTMHRLLHASGSHPIPPPDDPKTNQYNQDLGLIHSTNGNHLESPNEGSSIDHQVTIYLHAQNITMFPTNETCEGTPKLDWSKISSWNSNGTPKLVQQFTSISAGNTKLVHRLGISAARRSSENEENFKHRIKSRIEVCSKAEASKQLKSRKEQNKLSCRQQEVQMQKLLYNKIKDKEQPD
ncbi:hypothetical protein F511_34710 [Dorcoceras hygrometricum]|uniref:Uncharacterized protein n=1 Tax=Dorcoceras hygrometricum TaxID=472368 RepID=A0A2Z7B5U7_9LAMI|nr:hypothetical protein F511_34710 [Dorcoceras hygrometricum]